MSIFFLVYRKSTCIGRVTAQRCVSRKWYGISKTTGICCVLFLENQCCIVLCVYNRHAIF